MARVRLAGAGVAVVVGVARSGGCGSGRYGGGAGVVAAVGVSSAGTTAAGVALASKMRWSSRSVAAAVWPQRQWWQRHSRLYEGRVATTTSRADRKCRIS